VELLCATADEFGVRRRDTTRTPDRGRSQDDRSPLMRRSIPMIYGPSTAEMQRWSLDLDIADDVDPLIAYANATC
jgi:hypothetical protein